MKPLFAAAVFLSVPLYAQIVPWPAVIQVASAPNGACSNAASLRAVVGGGLYQCVSATWTAIGGSAATVALSSLANPTGNLSLATGSNTQTFTGGAATSTNNLWTFVDTASNTGTGNIVTIGTATGSAATPLVVQALGATAFSVTAAGVTQPNGALQCATDGGCSLGVLSHRFGTIQSSGGITFSASNSITWGSSVRLTGNATLEAALTNTSSNAPAGLLQSFPVSTKTSNYTLLFTDNNRMIDNTGAVGAVALALPVPVTGMQFHATVAAAQTFGFTASSGVTICNSTTCSATAGTITSNVVNNTVWLYAVSTTKWVVIAITGTWTIT